MSSSLPIVVIGAGIIGLACARELASRGRWVIVLDKEPTHGRGTSSRNSEVVHAGIYYAPGSLKARLCVEGRGRLWAYLTARNLPHRRCGKLIVATTAEEVSELELLQARAEMNGVRDMEEIDGARVSALEPSVQAVAALLSPSTGIVDVHALMDALAADAAAAGADFAYHQEVVCAEPRPEGEWRLTLRAADATMEEVDASAVVNATGLYSDRLAESCLPGANLPRQRWVKGNYFGIRSGSAVHVDRLVYPVPLRNLQGLGVHLTLDLAGGLRLGPDVEPMGNSRDENYSVSAERGEAFFDSARRFLPSLQLGDLSPAYSGLRPQLANETGFRDFYISEESERGAPGWVNLIGIESPGLTCALAIGPYVAGLLEDRGE